MSESVEHYEIRVFLYKIEPVIWREISVPATATFWQLHELIQSAMGWKMRQLHEFRHGKGRYLKSVIATPDEEIVKGDDFRDESFTTLKEVVGRKQWPFRMLYLYDFGDEWLHEVVFQKKSEGPAGKAELLGGERNGPPEDCGGAFTYMSCLHGDLEWMDDTYQPDKFDKAAAKKRMARVKIK